MNSNKMCLALLLFGLLAVTIMAGCTGQASDDDGNPVNTQSQNSTVIVTDMIGRDVAVPVDVGSVVPIAQGSSRILVYLDASDKIAGISESEVKSFSLIPYLVAHPELAKLPVVDSGGAGNPYPEEIVNISPDLIIASYLDVESADHIQSRTGVPVVVIKPGVGRIGYIDYNDDNNDFYRSMNLVASLIGKQDRADELISDIKDTVADLKVRTGDIPDDEKSSVYVGGISKQGSYGISSTQVKYPPFEWVYAENVVSGVNSSSNTVQISKEKILEWNPSVMFADLSNIKLIKDDLNSGIYDDVDAVKNGKIYGVLPYPRYGLNHEVVLANSYYVGSVLYPERFSDVSIESMADNIFEAFNGGNNSYGIISKKIGGYGVVTV